MRLHYRWNYVSLSISPVQLSCLLICFLSLLVSHSSSPLVFMHSLPPSPVFSLAGLADSVSEDSSHVPLLLLLRLFLLLPSSMSLSFFHSRMRAGTNATHLSVPLPLLLHPSLCTHGCVPTPPAPPGQEHVIAFANNPHRLRSSEITDSG